MNSPDINTEPCEAFVDKILLEMISSHLIEAPRSENTNVYEYRTGAVNVLVSITDRGFEKMEKDPKSEEANWLRNLVNSGNLRISEPVSTQDIQSSDAAPTYPIIKKYIDKKDPLAAFEEAETKGRRNTRIKIYLAIGILLGLAQETIFRYIETADQVEQGIKNIIPIDTTPAPKE